VRGFGFAAGPTDKTLDDFWLMVWMQSASRIVMVTKIVEGFRVCHLTVTHWHIGRCCAVTSVKTC